MRSTARWSHSPIRPGGAQARRLQGRRPTWRTEEPVSIAFILAIVALVCGILMLVAGRWSKWPLAAIAIICLALIETGFLSRVQ